MAKQRKPLTPAQLAAALVKGLRGAEVTHRHVEREKSDSYAVKVGGKLVAQVLARRRLVRLNLKAAPPGGVALSGEVALTASGRGGDKGWPGGGFVVTDGSAGEARRVLEAAVAAAPVEAS